MSKWTAYQWLVIAVFTVMITLRNIFTVQITKFLSFIEAFIAPSLLIIFFTVILVIWGWAILLLCQEKKGRPLFTHKIWAIMPAIVGILFLISFVVLIISITMYSLDISQEQHWLLDVMIFYFLSLFYLFVLSVALRYGKPNTSKNKIVTAANYAVLILFVILYLLPFV